MSLSTLSVTQLNEYVRRVLASDPMLRKICVVGEISNLKHHVSGHWYFTLKDEEAAINCAMFRTAAAGLHFRPANGMRVRLFGSVSLYAKTGTYQFYVDNMDQDGVGALYLQFEALKQRLMQEGLFDSSLKKPIPEYVSGIGIVTSKTGAVVHDIARVAWRRSPSVQLYLCPASVQGANAADEIVKAIRLLDSYEPAQVIIVGRGGGSMEDLWPFNEEKVARAIAACKKPVISAVGHETDFTIADFVADLRAPTPSAAAELAVQRQDLLLHQVEGYRGQMYAALEKKIAALQLRLAAVRQQLSASSPEERTHQQLNRVQQLKMRIQAAYNGQLDQKAYALAVMVPKLHSVCESRLNALDVRLAHTLMRMRTAGPVETVRRGYAIVMKNGVVVKNAAELAYGDKLSLMMNNGTVAATVDHVEKGS